MLMPAIASHGARGADNPDGGTWYSQLSSATVVPSASRNCRPLAGPDKPPWPHMLKTLSTITFSPALSSLAGTAYACSPSPNPAPIARPFSHAMSTSFTVPSGSLAACAACPCVSVTRARYHIMPSYSASAGTPHSSQVFSAQGEGRHSPVSPFVTHGSLP